MTYEQGKTEILSLSHPLVRGFCPVVGHTNSRTSAPSTRGCCLKERLFDIVRPTISSHSPRRGGWGALSAGCPGPNLRSPGAFDNERCVAEPIGLASKPSSGPDLRGCWRHLELGKGNHSKGDSRQAPRQWNISKIR